jgi:hypothetical protein
MISKLLLLAFFWVDVRPCGTSTTAFGWTAAPRRGFRFRIGILKKTSVDYLRKNLQAVAWKKIKRTYVIIEIIAFVLIVLVFVVELLLILIHYFIFESFTGEVVNRTRDDLTPMSLMNENELKMQHHAPSP